MLMGLILYIQYSYYTLHIHTDASKFLLQQTILHTHTQTHIWQLCQEASSRSILLYSFICFVMKANFWKLTLAVTSICFRHLWAMQMKPMNIQTGLSLEAQVLRLAYSWWRESCGPAGRWEKGSKSSYPSSPPPHPFFFSLSGHMLNESSADLEQFMSWQTCLFHTSTQGHLIYLSCVHKTVFLFSSQLSSPCLVFPPPSLIFHFQFLSVASCLLHTSALWCFTCFFLNPFLVSSVFLTSHSLSVSLSLTLPLHFHFPTSLPLRFLPTARAFYE